MLFGPRPHTTQPHSAAVVGIHGQHLASKGGHRAQHPDTGASSACGRCGTVSPGQLPLLGFCAGCTMVREYFHAAGDRVRAGLPRDRIQAHRLWPRDPGPQHLHRRAPTVERVLIMPLPAQSTDPTVLVTRTYVWVPDHRGFATSGLHQPGDLLPRPPRLHVPRGASSEVHTGEAISRALHHGLHRRGPGLCLLHAADGVAQQVPPRLGTGGRHQWPASTSTLAPWHVSARGRTYPERLPPR